MSRCASDALANPVTLDAHQACTTGGRNGHRSGDTRPGADRRLRAAARPDRPRPHLRRRSGLGPPAAAVSVDRHHRRYHLAVDAGRRQAGPDSSLASCQRHDASIARAGSSSRAGRPARSGGSRRTARFVTIASRYQGKKFNSPNDIVVRSDGTVYWTDSAGGLVIPGHGRRGPAAAPGHAGRVLPHAAGRGASGGRGHGLSQRLVLQPGRTILYVNDTRLGSSAPSTSMPTAACATAASSTSSPAAKPASPTA